MIRALVSHFLQLDYAAQLNRKVSLSYIGSLTFSGQVCTGYDEWGIPAGFKGDEEQLPRSVNGG